MLPKSEPQSMASWVVKTRVSLIAAIQLRYDPISVVQKASLQNAIHFLAYTIVFGVDKVRNLGTVRRRGCDQIP